MRFWCSYLFPIISCQIAPWCGDKWWKVNLSFLSETWFAKPEVATVAVNQRTGWVFVRECPARDANCDNRETNHVSCSFAVVVVWLLIMLMKILFKKSGNDDETFPVHWLALVAPIEMIPSTWKLMFGRLLSFWVPAYVSFRDGTFPWGMPLGNCNSHVLPRCKVRMAPSWQVRFG